MTQLIWTSCGLDKDKAPTLIYENNAACVSQMKEGYVKSDRTKHIPPNETGVEASIQQGRTAGGLWLQIDCLTIKKPFKRPLIR
ncbi:hypothetical protein LXL04_017559 [Taraxacum kok-saghyz]